MEKRLTARVMRDEAILAYYLHFKKVQEKIESGNEIKSGELEVKVRNLLPQEAGQEFNGKVGLGSIVIYDGPQIEIRLDQAEVFAKKVELEEKVEFSSKGDVAKYILDHADQDTIHIVNTAKRKGTTYTASLRNHYQGIDITRLESRLPKDFSSKDESIDNSKSGARTDAAMITAERLNEDGLKQKIFRSLGKITGRGSMYDRPVGVLLFKETSYANTPFGTVSEFGEEGINWRYHIEKDETNTGPFVDPENHIVGILEEYKPDPSGGPAQIMATSYVSIDEKNNLRYHALTPESVTPPVAPPRHSSYSPQYASQ